MIGNNSVRLSVTLNQGTYIGVSVTYSTQCNTASTTLCRDKEHERRNGVEQTGLYNYCKY